MTARKLSILPLKLFNTLLETNLRETLFTFVAIPANFRIKTKVVLNFKSFVIEEVT